MVDKVDLKRLRPDLFRAPVGRFVEITVSACRYLMADGHGDPNETPAYRAAVETLYATAYTLKFASKLHDEIMPAQGYAFAGPHHEVDLGDPRRTASDRLKTLLRQPVRRAGDDPAVR